MFLNAVCAILVQTDGPGLLELWPDMGSSTGATEVGRPPGIKYDGAHKMSVK